MLKLKLQELNSLDQAEFVRRIGPVFEHSPWIAEAAWTRRPFADLVVLHAALCETVRRADDSQKLALIRSHLDLADRAALAGALTRESKAEQASAGLDRLEPEELDLFQQRTAAYRAKFGFPFVICARLNDKDTIFAELARRLDNAREEEIRTAISEIFKIAELRLRNIICE